MMDNHGIVFVFVTIITGLALGSIGFTIYEEINNTDVKDYILSSHNNVESLYENKVTDNPNDYFITTSDGITKTITVIETDYGFNHTTKTLTEDTTQLNEMSEASIHASANRQNNNGSGLSNLWFLMWLMK